MRLIIFRQKNDGDGAASLGQHIKLGAIGGVINGQQAGTRAQGPFVFDVVGGVEVASIAAHMPVNRVANFIGGNFFQRGRRDDNPTKKKLH